MGHPAASLRSLAAPLGRVGVRVHGAAGEAWENLKTDGFVESHPNVAKDATLGWGTRRSHPPAQNAGRVGHPAGDEPGQPRTPPLRKNLQYRPPSPGSRLPNPSPVSPPELIPTKRMKSVTYPLDEYTGLTVPCNETRVEGE
jgi:hypothetical protein